MSSTMHRYSRCPYLKSCPIFQYFQREAEKVYTKMYCLADYEKCKRHQLKITGAKVPDNLLPYGGTLWDED